MATLFSSESTPEEKNLSVDKTHAEVSSQQNRARTHKQSKPHIFPFTAVVGQDDLRVALILNAIAPEIGGVVVRGEKGTAKTTTVRGFAPLIGGRLVNLPLGATEDRVVGSLNMETVLTMGKVTYEPGLLAQANKGILYVDEVNLLADHLVDALLDAAATGHVTVERDGVSHTSPARFVLVGTMNPEEGELRPQLLDRFGLSVSVSASKDPTERVKIVRRRLEFDDDPETFCARWEPQERELHERIKNARMLIDAVTIPDAQLLRISAVCAAAEVDGVRADVVIARTARAHAAWEQRTEVGDEDVRVAARYALPHRKRRDPFDEPGISEEELDHLLEDAAEEFPDDSPADHSPEEDTMSDPGDTPEQEHNSSDQHPDNDTSQPTSDGKESSADQGAQFRF